MWGRTGELALGLALAAAGTALVPAVDGASPGAGGAPSATSIDVAPRVVLPAEPPEPPIVPLGAAFDDDASLPAHAESTHRTTIAARLDAPSHVVHGEGTIAWKNTSVAPVTELWVHLYLNAFKNERTLFLRTRLGEGRGDRAPSDWGYMDVKRLSLRGEAGPVELWPSAERTSPGDAEDETDVRVPLPSPCPPGGELTLDVVFDAKLPTITERTGYHGTFHMVAQWFPKLARLSRAGRWNHFPFHRLSEFSADFGSYDVSLDVPAGFVVGATGTQVSSATKDGRTTSRWTQDDVHDFAWTAWDGFEETKVTAAGVVVRHLAPKGHAPVVQQQLAAAAVGLRCYGRRFGRYPYPVLTIVHPPPGAEEAGGMEYPTLITTGGPWFGPPAVRIAESLTIHEFGHQHFYGLLATDEHASPFLDEGLNSYAEQACLREMFGDGSAIDLAGLSIREEALQREGALSAGLDDVIARGAADFPSARHYGRLVYSRSATLMATLAGAFGEDVVERALGRYARAYRFRHPDPRHLLAAFEDVGGPALAEALRVGLYERGWVDFAVTDVASSKRSSAIGVFDRASGRETLSTATPSGEWDGFALVVRRGNLRMPVDVDLLLADGTRKRVRWSGEEDWVRIGYAGASELVGAVVDPEGKVLLDEQLANNGHVKKRQRVAYRVLERGAYAFSLAGFLLSP